MNKRLVSSNDLIRGAAKNEFLAMDENNQKQALLGMLDVFASEEDPYKRNRLLDTLLELESGPFVVIPLVKAAAKNTSIRDFKEITAFLSKVKADDKDMPELREMLKSGAWEARMLAMTSLSMLSKKAEIAIPEMMAMLKEFGADAGKYSRIFDCMAMINPEIAVAGIIKDINDRDGEIRRNAVEKLIELQAYLGAKLPVKKDIIPALIRALYSGDAALSELAQEGLSKIDDPDARNAAAGFMKMGKMALNMLYKMAGTTAEEVFKKQEDGVIKKINDYYRSIGREDAVVK